MLIAVVLATRLVSPLRDALQGVAISREWRDTFSGSFQPHYHPETMLLLSFALGASGSGRPWASCWRL